jgi:hypothetical protein
MGNARPSALDAALRTALESLVVAVADQAAERVFAAWRSDPAGAALLRADEALRARDDKPGQELSAAGLEGQAGLGGSARLVFGEESAAWAASVAASADAESGETGHAVRRARQGDRRAASLNRSSPDLPGHAARAVSAWQDHLMRLIQAESQANRLGGRAGQDTEPLALLALLGVLADGAAGTGTDDEIVTIPREMLAQSFGASKVADLLARARADLRERVQLLLDEEALRFVAVLEAAGPVDPVAAVRLYQAEYSLEAAR